MEIDGMVSRLAEVLAENFTNDDLDFMFNNFNIEDYDHALDLAFDAAGEEDEDDDM